MTNCTKQKHDACRSCPWTKAALDRGTYFDPEVIDRTTIAALRAERLHPCHSKGEYFCTGYLSFVLQHVNGGIMSLMMGRMAIGFDFLDPDRIDRTIEVFESVEDMLESHGQMLRSNDRQRHHLAKQGKSYAKAKSKTQSALENS